MSVPLLRWTVLLVLTLNLAALSVVRERENGTLEQLLVTPLRTRELLLGKMIPFILFGLMDAGLIFLVALYGAYLEWARRRWVVVWLVVGMTFLLIWPTKWPQYTLVVLPAYCLAASAALRDIYHRLREQETYWEWFANMFPRPSRRYITVVVVIASLFILIIALNTAILTYNRLNWATVTKENSAATKRPHIAMSARDTSRSSHGVTTRLRRLGAHALAGSGRRSCGDFDSRPWGSVDALPFGCWRWFAHQSRGHLPASLRRFG
jgi:hypothetical protein